jgi:hypothetical protein
MKSIVKQGSKVVFPKFTKERVYMIPFTKESGLQDQYSRWNNTAQDMLDGIDVDGIMYFMADQGEVQAGSTHRRGGAHIDGNYGPTGFGNPGPPGFKIMEYRMPDDLTGGILLASTHTGCKAYSGTVEGNPAKGGDCSHLDLSATDELIMKPSHAYFGNVTMIHESLPTEADQERTVCRIILPDNYMAA